MTEAGTRVTVYDRRGFGAADKPGTGDAYDTLADDLADVQTSPELQVVTFLGVSMGRR